MDVLEAVGCISTRAFRMPADSTWNTPTVSPRFIAVGVRVVQGQRGQIHDDAALGQQIRAAAQQSEGLQSQEVELHEPGGLDPLHVELGHPHAGLRVAVEGHELFQRPVADDDAGGVVERAGAGPPASSRSP